MISLPNGCKCSKLSVNIKGWKGNWQTAKAPVNRTWTIFYRFYDKSGRNTLIRFRSKINQFQSHPSRKAATETAISDELDRLLSGYNPVTTATIAPPQEHFEIHPQTPLVQALKEVKLKVAPRTLGEIRKNLVYIEKAARILKMATLPIADVRKKHMKRILEIATDGRSASTYNHYRAYLSMLFKELVELEAIEQNPVTDISKRKEVKNIRETLTEKQRQEVDTHLREHHYTFWRFVHIFFHSGARESELMRLRGRDVNLDDQTFKVTVLKGKKPGEVRKVIKDVALGLWEEAVAGCDGNDYVFSKGLQPGPVAISSTQITRRWKRLVKEPLGISADIYSLKHSNTTETVDLLSDIDAAKQNSHQGTAMVAKVYDIKHVDRQKERLKKVGNKFA
jgi:integrase